MSSAALETLPVAAHHAVRRVQPDSGAALSNGVGPPGAGAPSGSVSGASPPGAQAQEGRIADQLEQVELRMDQLRREAMSDRQDRVDDLAVLLDLATTGWSEASRRLARIERTLARIEAGEPSQRRTIHEGPVSQTDSFAPELPIVTNEPAVDDDGAAVPPPKRWLSIPPSGALRLLAALLLLAAISAGVLAYELLGSSGELQTVESAPEERAVEQPEPTTSLSSTTSAAAPQENVRTTQATRAGSGTTGPNTASTPASTTPTGSANREGAGSTNTSTAGTPTGANTTSTPARTTPSGPGTRDPTSSTNGSAAGKTTAATPQPSPGPTLTPASRRSPDRPAALSWPAVPGATFYRVRVLRGSELLYEAWPSRPTLVLPKSLVLRPGVYRWIVERGLGAPAGKRVGEPIVDSAFVLES